MRADSLNGEWRMANEYGVAGVQNDPIESKRAIFIFAAEP